MLSLTLAKTNLNLKKFLTQREVKNPDERGWAVASSVSLFCLVSSQMVGSEKLELEWGRHWTKGECLVFSLSQCFGSVRSINSWHYIACVLSYYVITSSINKIKVSRFLTPSGKRHNIKSSLRMRHEICTSINVLFVNVRLHGSPKPHTHTHTHPHPPPPTHTYTKHR